MKEFDLKKVFGWDVTNEALNDEGFFKVDQRGGSFIIVSYYNPETDEGGTLVARDYDYEDKAYDNDSIYYADINEFVKKKWLHSNGFILEGDRVMVVSGRKIPKGTVHSVIGKKEVYDRYGRWLCDYLIFSDGLATNEKNCIRIVETETITA